MERRYKVITPPAAEPISLNEAKNYLKLTGITSDDTLITDLIVAARQEFESYTNRAVILQTIEEKYDAFPISTKENPLRVIYPTISPLVAVTSITYKVSATSNAVTLSQNSYVVDTHTMPARITPTFEQDYPTAYNEINAVTVTYTAGAANAAAVPAEIRRAIYLLLAGMYFVREDKTNKYRTSAEKLMQRLRIQTY